MGSPFASKTRKNPIHGMSMALHSSFSSAEIPPASAFQEKATKVGHLKKLSGKGILTSGTWRDRFCLLVKSKLYFYENEKSEGTEKSCGFVNLEYFDTCTEATTRMARKATNVFVIGSTEKGFFESHSGRHYFAAETVTEMKEWVNAINSAMNHIRGKEKRTRDGSLTPAPGLNKKDSLKSKSKEEDKNGSLPRSGDRLDHVTKSRVKGPQGRRLPRKSHMGRVSGIADSRPDGVDSLVDSDEDVRDSRGRATSLSALEASSISHPKQQSISSSNGDDNSRMMVGRNGAGKANSDTWSNGSAESDMIDSQDMDLVYHYSSEEDSDEENRIPPQKGGKSTQGLIRSPNMDNGNSNGTYVQKRGFGCRGTTPLRNSSVTPPCVLRKFRREQNRSIDTTNTGLSNSTKDLDRNRSRASASPSPIFLPDGEHSKPQRTGSGSSLSTLTADTYVSNNVTLMGHYEKQNSFSSLQRPSRKNGSSSGTAASGSGGLSGSNGGGCYRPVSSSANVSPLLGTNSGLTNGHYQRSKGGGGGSVGSSSPYGAPSPNGTFDRNGSTAKAFHLEWTMNNVRKELEAASQEVKQIETDMSGVKQDVGNVQENVASVGSLVDATKERVTKLQGQVGCIEKQVASMVKEAQNMRDQAKKLLEMAESSKDTYDNLMEEAEHLVSFLRQSASQSYQQHNHNTRSQFPPSFCSGKPNGGNGNSSQYYGNAGNGGGAVTPYNNGPIVSLRRKGKGKTPERGLDSEPEIELLDETLTQMESIIAKHRKSKALLSGSSSSSSGGSGNHNNNAHRNSMIEIGENVNNIRSLMNNNRSPKAVPRVSVGLK